MWTCQELFVLRCSIILMCFGENVLVRCQNTHTLAFAFNHPYDHFHPDDNNSNNNNKPHQREVLCKRPAKERMLLSGGQEKVNCSYHVACQLYLELPPNNQWKDICDSTAVHQRGDHGG